MQTIYRDDKTKETYIGYKVDPNNEYICVSFREDGWRIFNMIKAKPFIPVTFKDKETALQVGRILHKAYKEFFDILDIKEWRDVDLPRLLQYTIPDGEKLYQEIEKMSNQGIIHEVSNFFYSTNI